MRSLLLLLAVGLPLLVGCRGNPAEQLPDNPDELTLFSIDGPAAWKQDMQLTPEQQRGEVLFGYPVLGKVEVTDPGERRAVVTAIKEASRADVGMGGCFIPRHAVRAVKAGRVIHLVVCFQCYRTEAHRGDWTSRPGRISRDAQPLLNQLLTAAGVPLAPTDPE